MSNTWSRRNVYDEIRDLKEQVKNLEELVGQLMDQRHKPTFMDFKLIKKNDELSYRLEYQQNYLPF